MLASERFRGASYPPISQNRHENSAAYGLGGRGRAKGPVRAKVARDAVLHVREEGALARGARVGQRALGQFALAERVVRRYFKKM